MVADLEVGTGRERRAGGRFRLSLNGLAVLVAAAALTAAALRRPRITNEFGQPLPGPTLGLVLVVLGMLAATVLARQAWARRGAGPAATWPIAWRLVALTLLGLFVAHEAALLRVVPLADQADLVWAGDSWRRPFHAGFVPACGLLGALGLSLGLAPAPSGRERPGPAGLLRSWLSVLAAGLAGLGLLSLVYGPISTLVLIAIEAVQNALNLVPMHARRVPGLAGRLDAVIPELLAAATCCVVTGAWLTAELRAGADAAWSRAGRIGRALSVLATAAAGLWLLTVTLPRLSPPLVEGLALLLDRADRSVLAAGLALLSLDLAARATARREPRPTISTPPSWSRRIGRVLLVLAGGVLLLDGVRFALADALGPLLWPGPQVGDPLRVPRWLATSWTPWASWYERWMHNSGLPSQLINGPSTPNPAPWQVLLLDPSQWPLLIAAGYLLVLLAARVLGPRSGAPSAFDAVATDRHRVGRFLSVAVGFVVLLAAALPTFVLGMLVVGFRTLRLGDH